jgi:menaquinone-9 beta-reductase
VPTDVLVVGAGPAGSVAALTLARAGATVRLVDRARFPRDKLCGDTVNPGSLALLDALGLGGRVRAASLPVAGMTVTGPHGARITADYPHGIAGAALTRRHLDQGLLEAAIAAGVSFDEGVSISRAGTDDSGRVNRVVVRHAGVESDLATRLVIAADGRASRLASSLGLSWFARRPRRWAFGAYYQGVEGVTDRGEMHVRRDGYIGVAPVPGGLVNVCVVGEVSSDPGTSLVRLAGAGLPPSRSTPASLVEVSGGGRTRSVPQQLQQRVLDEAIRSDSQLRDRFARAERISDVTVLGPLAVDARAAGCSGLLLAGDAAGFLDPMTGDGLRFALQGGVLAAEYALRELETGRPQHPELHAARVREFSRKWLVNRALRALVASPRGVAIAAGVSAHWNAPVRSLIAIAGDVQLALDRRAA